MSQQGEEEEEEEEEEDWADPQDEAETLAQLARQGGVGQQQGQRREAAGAYLVPDE